MNSFASATTIALLAAGCASRSAPPPASATASRAQPAHATANRAQPAHATPPSQSVELRHFYLLSPGPSSTLVVTRSDTGTAAQ